MIVKRHSNEFKPVGLINELQDGGDAIVFDIDKENFLNGFVIKYQGELFAYRNQCPHNGSQLDWTPGKVFDETGEWLVCATHGAIFHPQNGRCAAGPCVNQRLISLPVRLQDEQILVRMEYPDSHSGE